jgi:miniconductance mechanosensitive channel
MGTVKFLDDEMLERLKKVSLLKDYLKLKELDIEQWNNERNVSKDDLINARAMTNIGTFRAYVNEYLKGHTNLSKTDTVLVRLLQPSEHGLPLEVYVFTNDNNWIEYERIQSDIFDHLFAVLAVFDLRVFQSPSGADVVTLSGKGLSSDEV